jgi:hypothetical protein
MICRQCSQRLQQVISCHTYIYMYTYNFQLRAVRASPEQSSKRVVTYSHIFASCAGKIICPRKFRNGPFKRQSMTQRNRMAAQHAHLKVLPPLPPSTMDATYPSMSYAPAKVTLRPACPTLHAIESTFVRMIHGTIRYQEKSMPSH